MESNVFFSYIFGNMETYFNFIKHYAIVRKYTANSTVNIYQATVSYKLCIINRTFRKKAYINI